MRCDAIRIHGRIQQRLRLKDASPSGAQDVCGPRPGSGSRHNRRRLHCFPVIPAKSALWGPALGPGSGARLCGGGLVPCESCPSE
ncbi:unnamed protein product [Merluccius merluccius]